MRYLIIMFLLTSCSNTKPCKVVEIGKCERLTQLLHWDEADRCSVKCQDGRGEYLINPIIGATYD